MIGFIKITVFLLLFVWLHHAKAETPSLVITPSERQQVYLKSLARMRERSPIDNRIEGDVSEIVFGHKSKRVGQLSPFWRTRVMTDRWLEATAWALPPNDSVLPLLEMQTGRKYTDFARTSLLSDTIATVRLLGGWASPTDGSHQDLAYRNEAGKIIYRWELLHARLDPIVDSHLSPFIVLDNIPYCFAPHGAKRDKTYGQNKAPVDFHAWEAFVEALCQELANYYGFEKANSWRYRIGTEMDNIHHWESGSSDSLEKYLKTYDHATAAIRRVLPGAKVGPCNFNSRFAGQLNRSVPPMAVFEHFAKGTNYATSEVGSPVDYVAISSYGMYWMGGKFDHRDAARHGYSPETLRLHTNFLKELRSVSPRFKNISLEIQEHGTLNNEDGLVSHEPGSFGAAWTAAQYAIGLEEGISKFFVWRDYENIGGNTFLFGNAWLRTMLEKMLGGEVLIPEIRIATSGSWLNGFAVRQSDTLWLVLSNYSAERAIDSTEKIRIRFDEEDILSAKNISQYRLDRGTAPYDVMASDLKVPGELAGLPNVLKAMATPQGVNQIRHKVHKYWELQKKSFDFVPFEGKVNKDDYGVTILLDAPTPSVTILRIDLNSVR